MMLSQSCLKRRAASARRAVRAALAVCLVPAATALCDARAADISQPRPAAAAPSDLALPQDVRRVIDRRCAVCHGCYDSPCQLKMTSAEGLLRGASKAVIYNAQRLEAAPQTRLGIDGRTTEDWRRLGFFSVGPDEDLEKIETSQIWNMLKLKRDHPLKPGAPLPASLSLDLNRPLSCARRDEFSNYARDHPLGGMPYAAAGLTGAETQTLRDWLKAGSPMSVSKPAIPERLNRRIAEWERLLNQRDPKHKLVARYLYEHLFLAHLYFDGDRKHFFRLARSTTPPGAPVQLVRTRRPYDDPGVKEVYYRLTPIKETLLRKTHIVYRLGAGRLDRVRELFIRPEWTVRALPSYEPAIASNPFKAFADIPPLARSQFLLDDALFFIRTFVRGPSCRGQVAVDVIDDRFWVMFLSPAADLSVTDLSFLREAAEYLGLPAEQANAGLGRGANPAHLAYHHRYLRYRKKRYNQSDPDRRGFSLKDIWDGGRSKDNALLTVFRHFDSASVVSGFAGGFPKTAWVIDYPILERIYYNLVAGFDVYGNVGHQLGSRIYMDLLRMEGEELFLQFLPRRDRRRLQRRWYDGVLAKTVAYLENGRVDLSRGVRIDYRTGDAMKELLRMAATRGQRRWSSADPINRCAAEPCADPSAPSAVQDIQKSLHEIASVRGRWVRETPELSLLRIRDEDGSSYVYSLAHDRAHSNVAFIFYEDARLRPERDELTVYPGYAGSYPNFFFEVTRRDLPVFVQALKAVSSTDDFLKVVARFGVRRSSPGFWEVADAHQDAAKQQEGVEAGLLDLSRYVDPKPEGAVEASVQSEKLLKSALANIRRQVKKATSGQAPLREK
jgi:hypothetical protein